MSVSFQTDSTTEHEPNSARWTMNDTTTRQKDETLSGITHLGSVFDGRRRIARSLSRRHREPGERIARRRDESSCKVIKNIRHSPVLFRGSLSLSLSLSLSFAVEKTTGSSRFRRGFRDEGNEERYEARSGRETEGERLDAIDPRCGFESLPYNCYVIK